MNLDTIIASANGHVIAQGDANAATGSGRKFPLVVFCAEEFPPPKDPAAWLYGRPEDTLYAPNDDAQLDETQAGIAWDAARRVADAYRNGRSVLVTCMQGRNRSGLVTSIALHEIFGCGGTQAARVVRRQRVGARALTNPDFVRYLRTIPAASAFQHFRDVHFARPMHVPGAGAPAR